MMQRPAFFALALLLAPSPRAARLPQPVSGGELRFCLHAEPKNFNPLMASEEPEEAVQYLTGSVLIRINRQTQAFEPELAESWRVLDGGRKIEFKLRDDVRFSDGAPLTAADVLYSLRSAVDPALHSPAGEPFRTGRGPVVVSQTGPRRVLVSLPAPMAGMERLFDQVPVTCARAVEKSAHPDEMPVLGPFRIASYRAGSALLLERNPFYWKKDEAGRRLPYIDSVRLFVQQNRDLELARFLRGDIHLINGMDAQSFDRLAEKHPQEARNAGRSLESEELWFNQVARAPIPDERKEWFRSRQFRRAVAGEVNDRNVGVAGCFGKLSDGAPERRYIEVLA